MVHAPGADTDLFVHVVEVFQGDTLALYSLIIYRGYILWMSIDQIKANNDTKKGNKWTIICRNSDVEEDLELVANIPVQVESLQQVVRGIDCHVDAKK